MVGLAVKHIALAFNKIGAIIPRVAFANISVSTVTIATGLGAIRDIAKNSLPTLIAAALVRFVGITMNTRRITDRYVAAGSLVAIEALADFRSRAHSIYAALAYP